MKNNMKVVILAGGFRENKVIRVYKKIPKPMVKINNKPILVHIIDHYLKFGFKEFYIALGYKGNIIKNFLKIKS